MRHATPRTGARAVHRPRLRPLSIIALAALLALVVLPGVASAGPPTTTTSQGADIVCETDTGFTAVFAFEESDATFLDLFAETFGDDGYLTGFTDDVTFDGTVLTADVDVFRESFDDGEFTFVGVASVDATLTPDGQPETFSDRFREGNRWVRTEDVLQPATVAGWLVLDGELDIDLADCDANLFTSTQYLTNPATQLLRFDERVVDCGIEGGMGSVFAIDADFGTFLDVFVAGDDTARYGSSDNLTWTDTDLSGSVELFDDETGEPAGTATVDAGLTSLGVTTSDLVFQAGRSTQVDENFAVDGTVTIDGDTFELVDCFAVDSSSRQRTTDANGPRPGGPAPANDTPDGAALVGSRPVNAQTRGAANAPEAECTIEYEDEGGEFLESVPFGKTVWYRFTGTGQPVTLDTAGRDFDTVLAVYDADLSPLACADDVGDEDGFTLQAATTIDTVAGVTYLVQVGGYGGFEDGEDVSVAEFGHLRLTRS
ncbi:hypothetical protein [Salsipaludibacter albus]|uniref:hypothetical protein n=1 Tax=Salsipaludibacter albus TaxID=2849650 RepID=UPI001EE4D0E9|nr:hypothetical protein [Salsipaludibacter albus]MBY5161926.1 hypothetical protein [Salsipaludibacter albus]